MSKNHIRISIVDPPTEQLWLIDENDKWFFNIM